MLSLSRKGAKQLFLAAFAATAAVAGISSVSDAKPADAARPLYKDPSQPVERRVEDLLSRMTLGEKAAQLLSVWEHKDKIQTPDGTFSPEKASQAFPNGIGQIARPSDRRGVTAA